MTRALAHRGPDADGMFVTADGHGALGHRRLAIVDPQGGDQPIEGCGGGRAIVANGEIYNAPVVSPTLGNDHRVATRSDSEVALHLYEDHGAHGPEHLEGMFAFAIADGDELFLARDPLGIKPLYLGERNDGLLFASELKAFPAGTSRIRPLPPGTIWSSREGQSTYYTVPDPIPRYQSSGTLARQVRTVLEEAVTKRLMSDVPVGAFLSGGLDSSALAALARPHVDELHTFSVGVAGSPDLEAARAVAEHLDTTHHEHVLTPDQVAAHLPRIVWALESYDEDLVPHAVSTYFIARLAAEHVKVVLTGEGADELFAGYAYYENVGDAERLRRELRRSVTALHDINLQRVDRMTMAHSLEARVPFLDVNLIEMALGVPVEFKQASADRPEKWILRRAVADLLPEEVVWRGKQQFAHGSGTGDLLAEVVDDAVSGLDVADYRADYPEALLRSARECHYHRLLVDSLPNPQLVLDTVARWSDDRL